MTGFGNLADHLSQLRLALTELERHEAVLRTWAWQLADVFRHGGRLLAAGNGGSAAEAQHLTAELVGRFETDRPPLSAIALHAETSSLTALLNDFSAEEVYARQVVAHGRSGDVLVLLSTSGRSQNVVRAAERGQARGLLVWALTGPLPNPLAERADSTISIGTASATAVQEAHLVAVHALCAGVERWLEGPETDPGRPCLRAVAHPGRRHDAPAGRFRGRAATPTPPAGARTPGPPAEGLTGDG